MDLRTKKKRKPAAPRAVVPCQYDCGRPAQGTLTLHYTAFDADEDSYRHGFCCTVPCCRECLKGAVRLKLTIPEIAAK
jgi:hypothetical protein